jgi:hypothetical protein
MTAKQREQAIIFVEIIFSMSITKKIVFTQFSVLIYLVAFHNNYNFTFLRRFLLHVFSKC